MQKLYYIEQNREIPHRRVSSTARKGTKWDNLVQVGDEVELVITGTEEAFGRAVIVMKEVMPYSDVLENAQHNHVAFESGVGRSGAAGALVAALEASYGVNDADDTFTVLHILPINTVVPRSLGDMLGEATAVGCTAVEIIEVQAAGSVAVEKTIRYEF